MRFLAPLLCLTAHFQTIYAASSTLLIGDTNTTISINIPPSSNDVNFYVSTPDYYQYTALGFGSLMGSSLLLVMYPAANNRDITISPRFALDGYAEPRYNSSIKITVHPSSQIREHEMLVNATCHNCRVWNTGELDVKSTAQPMIFANGPSSQFSSDDPAASIRRHVVHGRFAVDLVRATGSGGVPLPEASAGGAELVGSVVPTLRSKETLAHGIVFAIATLVVAPADAILAGALRKWPMLHGISATVYVALVIGALVPGIAISKEHWATREFKTPHQVIGLIGVALVFGMFLWGIVMAVLRRGAKRRGGEMKDGMFCKVHRWTGRVIWVVLVVNGGLGLRLSERNYLFMMGYGVLVGAVFIVGLPIWFLVWRCTKYQRQKQYEEHELPEYSLYNHHHN